MSDTPNKKPAKKAQPKKAQPKPTASSKQPAKRGRPPKKAQPKVEAKPKGVASNVEEFLDELERIVASEPVDHEDSVVVRTNDVKSASLRKRMLKWFRK